MNASSGPPADGPEPSAARARTEPPSAGVEPPLTEGEGAPPPTEGEAPPTEGEAPLAEGGDAVLDVRDVTVRFGGLTALDAVSLSVPPRHVAGVIGPNGAGKTTLLNVLCGFIHPDHGEVRIGGSLQRNIRPHRLAALGVARTLQGVGLFSGLTALENVMVGATSRATAGFWSSLLSLPKAGRDERELAGLAREALETVGADKVADMRPGELSYGMRKRVALARALAGRPRLLLLDEPASGLDETELAELGHLIRDLATDRTTKNGGTSLVVVEHHMDLMMSVCDTITVLDFGKVIAKGTPQQVQADPAVTAAYLGTESTESTESTENTENTENTVNTESTESTESTVEPAHE